MFVHGAIGLYLKGFRPTLRQLRGIAAQVCLCESARVKDVFLDARESMRRLDNTIAELRRRSFKEGFWAPNRDVKTFPTRSLQESYFHMALDKEAPNAPLEGLEVMKDVQAKLKLRFFKRVHSDRVVVDDRWTGEQLFPAMLFACADQDRRQWITGSTSPKYPELWPEMHDFLANVKRYQIGPNFSSTYRRMQNELCLHERRIAAEEILASLEFKKGMTLSELQIKLSEKAFMMKIRKQAYAEFVKSEYFIGCEDSHALAIYKDGTTAPNCYRCRTVHRFNEYVKFDQDKIDKHFGQYEWNRRLKKDISCAECQVALQIAVWRYFNQTVLGLADRSIWSNKCDPAKWPVYDRYRSSGIPRPPNPAIEAAEKTQRHTTNKAHGLKKGLAAVQKKWVEAERAATLAVNKAAEEGTEEAEKAAKNALEDAAKKKKKWVDAVKAADAADKAADAADKAAEVAEQAVKHAIATNTGAEDDVAPEQPVQKEYRFEYDVPFRHITGATAQTAGFHKDEKIKTDSDECTNKTEYRGLTDSDETSGADPSRAAPPTAGSTVTSVGGIPHHAYNQNGTITPPED
jgi:hypothetical protein